MRLLVINPNTTEAITDTIVAATRVQLPGVDVIGATGGFGARYIASRASFAIGAHAALDCYARHAECDAVLLACFGDPGLDALREVATQPVTGLLEASIAKARSCGVRYAIITGGANWAPMLGEILRMRRLEDGLAGVLTVAPTGGDIAADPAGSVALLADACHKAQRDLHADVVILGGAGLVGLADQVAARTTCKVIGSVEAGIEAVKTLRMSLHKCARQPSLTDYSGVSRDLARLLGANE